MGQDEQEEVIETPEETTDEVVGAEEETTDDEPLDMSGASEVGDR